MPRIDSEKFYTSAIEMHGTSAKGVNWASKGNQQLRFDMLLQLLPQDLSSSTVADAGCGFGDLYTFMTKKKRTPKKYIGIDSLIDMYSIASAQTGCEIIQAEICKDVIPKADYYVCSGALNILSEFETHLFIQNCYKSSKKAFVFNALFGEQSSQIYNYLTKEKIDKIAKDLKVKEVTYHQGYLEHDITIRFLR
ncbi:class I SAM-dependent methyltransferase [Sulfurimonas sp.]|uniref:class I SAM-dependent methyltransferase n=1 Tax=Sulfurimonas sp. TaxID=2022749 RepID=UPI0026110E22|nr:class I SAM-dependent methyltransferase [Sulfurimonas sp.]